MSDEGDTPHDADRSAFHTPAGRSVPAVTADEMRAVDRVAVAETGPRLLQMMENAGRTLAEHALTLADTGTGADDRPITVLAGGGGNGGGGLCAARHLHDHSRDVRVLLDRPAADLAGGAATQRDVLAATPVPVHDPDEWTGDDDGPLAALGVEPAVVVDAVVGYGLDSALQGTAAALIAACQSRRTLSLDVPSGVVATTGERPGPAVEPDRTLTLALPKTGLAAAGGDLSLADIGIPPAVFERAGIEYPDPGPFDGEWSVPLVRSE